MPERTVSPLPDTPEFGAHELAMALNEHAIVAWTDARGRITDVNDKFCAISQYSRAELLGQDHRMINSGHHPQDFFRTLWHTISRGRVWQGEICNRAKDGSLYWVKTTIVPFAGPGGRPNRYIAIRTDITERKRAEREQARLLGELTQINQELNQFAHVVSHDLKAPLRAIGAISGWLATDYADRLGPDAKDQFELLLGRVHRLDALIDGILRYSKIGRTPEDRSPVDLNLLIAEVCELLAPPPGICIEIQPGLPVIRIDRTRITQVFENLVSNAIKYMGRPAGRIDIGCRTEPDGWTFLVRDTGPGIEEKYFHRIFQIFQTLSSRDERESTGIGLAIVKKNIEQCGGRVWIESTVGAGSTFFFRLPRQDIATPSAPTP